MVNSLFYPKSKVEYKIHYDLDVGAQALKVFDFLADNNIFQKTFLRDYVDLLIDSTKKEISVENSHFTLPYNLQQNFYNNVVRKINPTWGTGSCRLETIYPNSDIQGIHNRRLRLKELHSSDTPTINDFKLEHPSVLWHFDSKNNINTMVTVLYLSDVSKDGGGTTIADPIIRAIPKPDNTDGVGISSSLVDVKEIKSKTVTGKLGTAVTFNSFSLHRGGIPLDKPRKALIINFIPVENKLL